MSRSLVSGQKETVMKATPKLNPPVPTSSGIWRGFKCGIGMGHVEDHLSIRLCMILEGILKRYPEIGDCPEKVQSNPPKGSIKPLEGFYRTPQGSI